MPADKNSAMLKLDADGGGSFSPDPGEHASVECISISKDGMLYIGSGPPGGMSGPGALCAGDSVLISKFVDIRPQGLSLWIDDSRITLRDFGASSSSSYGGCDSETAEEFIDEFSEIATFVDMCKALVVPHFSGSTSSWDSVIPTAYRVGYVSNLEDVFLCGSDCKLGTVGRTRVLLFPMSQTPPEGTVFLAPGVPVKQVDVWLRRFERLVNTADYPPYALRPVGCFLEDSWYLVSLFPTDVLLEDLLDGPPVQTGLDSADALLDTILGVCKGVKFLESTGLTFNGFLNRNAFIFTHQGTVLLNTSYLLSRSLDKTQVFGGLSTTELRGLPPAHFPALSVPLECAVRSVQLESRMNPSQLQEDRYSLGLLILSLLARDGVPMNHLQHAQYVLCCLASAGGACEVPWLTAGWTGSLTEGSAQPATDLSPLERMASRLMAGDMSVDELIESIQKYQEWRDQMSSSSVKTEVKAMMTMVSGAFRTSQDFMKFR